MSIGLIIRSVIEFVVICFTIYLIYHEEDLIEIEGLLIKAIKIKIKQRRQKNGKH